MPLIFHLFAERVKSPARPTSGTPGIIAFATTALLYVALSHTTSRRASAAEQLAGITVGGRVPGGLAVSTVTMNGQLSYLAIDPSEGDEPSYTVDSNMIDCALDFRLQDKITDVPPDLLTNASGARVLGNSC